MIKNRKIAAKRIIRLAGLSFLPLFFLPLITLASVSFSEVMYDPKGVEDDGKRDWVEIWNSGSETDISEWRFAVGGENHKIYSKEGDLWKGRAVISGNSYAVIADNPEKFLTEWPAYSGVVFDSSFSLPSTGKSLELKNEAGVPVDQFQYGKEMGAFDDGNSLQKIGGVWKSSLPTPGAQNAESSSPQNSGSQNQDSQSQTSQNISGNLNGGNTQGNSGSAWPVDPQVFARVKGESLGVAGADMIFRGEALGIEKRPLEKVRYFWNFGDGESKEGETVAHSYKYPGEYLLVLEASSGNFGGGARLKVKIISSPILISSVSPGPDGFLEISNKSGHEINISSWILKRGEKIFVLPKGTIILSQGKIMISAKTAGMEFGEDAQIFYPNGFLAGRYEKITTVAPVAEKPAAILAGAAPAKIAAAPAVSPSPKREVSPAVSKTQDPPKSAIASADQNLASVSSADENFNYPETESGSVWTWLFYAFGLSILAVFAVLYSKREEKTAGDEMSEIEIIE